MDNPLNINDLYSELQEFADSLRDLSWSLDTDPVSSDKAFSMYSTLENVYLEPIRRQLYNLDTQALTNATTSLNKATASINQTITQIQNVIQTAKQLDQYAKIFDGVITLAAKIAAAVAA